MKVRGRNSIIFLIALFTVLSHSIYAYLNERIIVNSIYVILSFLPVLYCIIYGVKTHERIKWKIGLMIFGYFLMICSYGLLRVNSSDLISYLCRYVIFLPFMIMVFIDLKRQNNENILFKYISDIVFCIAVVSLFFWILGTILHIIGPTGRVWAVWGNAYRNVYLGIYLEVPGNISGTNINRNVGIFCEAPAFAYFLSIGFGFELLIRNNLKKWRGIIYIMALLSTGTTTGLLILVYVIVTRSWDKTSKGTTKHIVIRLGIIIMALLASLLIYRFGTSDSKMASVVLRKNDYINGFMVWLKNPISGVGYMAEISSQYSTGFSNSITQILVSGGLIFSLVYLCGFIGALVMAVKRKDKKYTYWVIMCGLLFSISIVGYAYITLVILASQYVYFISNNAKGRTTSYGGLRSNTQII